MFSSLFALIMQNMLYLMLHIGNNGSFPKPLSAADERDALEKAANGDKKAREKLIEHNLRLVAHIIKKYYSAYSDQEDLISIGTIGLIKGIDSFDMNKGIRLATYASRCVENEVLMYMRNKKKRSLDVSLNEPIDTDSEGNPLTLIDVIYTDDTIADDIDLKIKSEQVRKFVKELSDEREREIIIMRYGLNGETPLTQREIAKMLNISRSYVSRIEKKALSTLRKKFD